MFLEDGAASGRLSVCTPVLASAVDVVLLVDITGSYEDDLMNLKATSDSIWDTLAASTTGLRMGVAAFADFCDGEKLYSLVSDLTDDRTDWLAAVNSLVISSGNDPPEAQLVGITQTAALASWRDNAARTIILTTDARFPHRRR